LRAGVFDSIVNGFSGAGATTGGRTSTGAASLAGALARATVFGLSNRTDGGSADAFAAGCDVCGTPFAGVFVAGRVSVGQDHIDGFCAAGAAGAAGGGDGLDGASTTCWTGVLGSGSSACCAALIADEALSRSSSGGLPS
jgi:hypothetical protein